MTHSDRKMGRYKNEFCDLPTRIIDTWLIDNVMMRFRLSMIERRDLNGVITVYSASSFS